MKTLPEHKYKGHLTFWEYAKPRYNIERPTKYCVIFSTWKEFSDSFSCTEFDTLNDALDEAKELNKMYSNTPKPQKIYNKNGKHKDGIGWRYDNYDWDFSNGRRFWGYAILDMINCKFIKVINGVKNRAYDLPDKPRLCDIDTFFRAENEIPKNYQWDDRGEYAGWLQFRWGDGKNAIDYVEPEKKERPGVDEWREIYNEVTDTYKTKKVRVVYVGLDDPLPKREKGIIYERPNKEPVKFPNDLYGYENDYCMQPWSLNEEIIEDEYINNGGSLDKKDTTISIKDMLGDDNPLLKLKFN